MPKLATSGERLLHSMVLPDMKTAAATKLWTTPAGVTTYITKIVVRDASASLVGGTSYSLTGFRSAFSLVTFNTTTGCIVVYPADLSMLTPIVGNTAVNFTVTTGSTAAASAAIDVFGYTV